VLPADKAEQLLKRLHRFNLKWGMFAHGALFIPLISYVNYRIQIARIRSQIKKKGPWVSELET
jgi:hypothetical protein